MRARAGQSSVEFARFDSRVGVRNGHAKYDKIFKKQLRFDFFVTLNSPHGFLSLIFGS